MVKAWIINSVSKDLVHGMHYNPPNRSMWEDLRERFSKVDDTRIFHLHRDIYQMKQGILSIPLYFEKMKIMWDELVIVDDD